jgi:hypothetical protein
MKKNGIGSILQSGLIFSAVNFLTGLGNLAFQSVMGHHLKESGQYAHANSAINGFIPLLGLLPSVAVMAITHYIAHFNAIGDTARLQGLIAGCRRLLFHLTIVGSLLAVIIVKPLSLFFHYDSGLMLITLICTLVSLWASLATALCQGLAWFKRLALIGFLSMVLRVTFGYFVTLTWPSPETAVMASTVALFAYLVLLLWKKDLMPRSQLAPVSPWNHEFILYLTVSGAFAVGNYCFSQGDLMVMQRYFSNNDSDAYAAAERLAVSLPLTVGPLLTVLFTSRSVAHSAAALREQIKLLVLFAGTLIGGAICLLLLRHFCLRLLGKDTPEAAEMLRSLATTMVFVGLLQAVGTWALASRWTKVSLCFGALGLTYWLALLAMGKTPAALLAIMPVATGMAFTVLFLIWLDVLRRHKPIE